MESLWGDQFKIEDTKSQTKKILDKVSKPKKVKQARKKDVPLKDRISYIETKVHEVLGKYVDDTICIRDKESLHNYISIAISNGEIAIDTETNNSLDPITCKLMGACIYTPGQKNVYIPINHVNPDTRELLPNQLTEQDIKEEFDRLSNTKIIMHNAKFDYSVLKCTCGCTLKTYWDTMIGAKLLDENEKSFALKAQYIDKINPEQEKYDIEGLFEGLEYAIIPVELFALYAATDPYITYELYAWQMRQFQDPDLKKIFDLALDVEMPLIEVVAEMELTGIEVDVDYAHRLGEKYHTKLDNIQREIDVQISEYKTTIDNWRKSEEANFHPKSTKKDVNGHYKLMKSKNEQLKDPPEISSPTQLAILLYDVLKVPTVNSQSPRGTSVDILKEIQEKTHNKLCELVLKYREMDKLLGTYIDKVPTCINEKTHRLHASFNQLGAKTGRFSSSDPNLQNIPSHDTSVRMVFKASDGCVLVGSDFSLQSVG